MSASTLSRRALGGVSALVVMAMVAACGSTSSAASATPSASPVDVGSGMLTGAGATFPAPFYTKAFYQYNQDHSNVSVNYQAIGSGGGIKAFTDNTVDFGASDVPMKASEITAAGGPDSLVQIPTILGVVSVAYHLSGVSKLNLDGPTLANIYLGHITKWSDPAIAALNSGTTLPDEAIGVVHRSDGSGTSYAFSDYLSKVSDEWKTKVGASKSPAWPAGIGAPKNDGVAQSIQAPDGEGRIGYVELAYVIQANMAQAYLKNANGKFVQATVAGATAAAAQNSSVSATNFSITNEPGDTTYPIASFSWVILRSKVTGDQAKGRALVYLFAWLVTGGQSLGAPLQYAPLPDPVRMLAQRTLQTVTVNGQSVYTAP